VRLALHELRRGAFLSLKWSALLKASVIGVVFAATLLSPGLAHAYGRSVPTPNAFTDSRGAAQGVAGPAPRPFGAARYRHSRYGKHGYGSAAPHRTFVARRSWRSYRPASLRPVAEAPAAAPTFGDGSTGRIGRAAPAPVASFGGGNVVAEASRWVGSGKFTGLPGPWCADAVNVWLQRSGHRPLGGRMASAALSYGPRLEGPEIGALAVLGSRRGWAYHVGIVSGVESDGSIRLISGNWGRRVAEAVIPRGSVAAFVGVR